MVSILDREAIAEFLGRLDRKAVLAFASRAALRVVPLMWPLVDYSRAAGDGAGPSVILAAWRGVAASWLGAGFPTDGAEFPAEEFVNHAERSLSSDTTFLSSPKYLSAGSAVRAAADAAFAAADIDGPLRAYALNAGAAAAGSDAITAIAGAAVALDRNPQAAGAAVVWATDADIAILVEQGGSALLSRPLWLESQPHWLTPLWTEMRGKLKARDPNWRVWTDWQDARLAGEPAGAAAIELARIEPGASWELGPAVANAEIERRIASLM